MEVNGRTAWEFTMPPDGLGLDSIVAFDAQTGIPLQWEDKSSTLELSDVETDTHATTTPSLALDDRQGRSPRWDWERLSACT